MACMCGGCESCLSAQGGNSALEALTDEVFDCFNAYRGQPEAMVDRLVDLIADKLDEQFQAFDTFLRQQWETREEMRPRIGGPRKTTIPAYYDRDEAKRAVAKDIYDRWLRGN